jgi:hypothetical protein
VLKLVAAGAVVLALGAFALRSHGGKGAAEVASCLEKHGATASRSTFLRDALGIDASAEVPDELKKAEKHLFDVTVGSDSGLLMDTKQSHQEARLLETAAAQGFDVTPQSRGKVMLIWFGGPSGESRAIAADCL